MPLSKVESDLLRIHLPEDNIFGASDRKGPSVAPRLGFLLGPIEPGHARARHPRRRHPLRRSIDFTNTTTIIVTKR